VRGDFVGRRRRNHLVILLCNIQRSDGTMANPDDLSIGRDIDIDRVIIDPDYRRVVIAMLRQTRSPSEAEPAAPKSAAPPSDQPG